MTYNHQYKVDYFKEAHAIIDKDVEGFVKRLLPYGVRQGREWVAINPRRNDHHLGSLKINLMTGRGSDFAIGKTFDVISLYGYIHGVSNCEAAKEIINSNGNLPIPQYSNDNHAKFKATIKKYTAVATQGTLERKFKYYDAHGVHVLTIGRFVDERGVKTCCKPIRDGNCLPEFPKARRYLYNLPAIIANPEKDILVVEGEKDAETFKERFFEVGYVVTTSCGGAYAAKKCLQQWEVLAGRNIVIIPDDDDAGARYAVDVVNVCRPYAKSLNILNNDKVEKFIYALATIKSKGVEKQNSIINNNTTLNNINHN